jgi:hypothetical protein
MERTRIRWFLGPPSSLGAKDLTKKLTSEYAPNLADPTIRNRSKRHGRLSFSVPTPPNTTLFIPDRFCGGIDTNTPNYNP